jgi:hypothetical protein
MKKTPSHRAAAQLPISTSAIAPAFFTRLGRLSDLARVRILGVGPTVGRQSRRCPRDDCHRRSGADGVCLFSQRRDSRPRGGRSEPARILNSAPRCVRWSRIGTQIQIVGGLEHLNATAGRDGAGDHARANGTFLTGVRMRKSATDIRAGISIDQVMAQKVGHLTRLPSLELTCDARRNTGACDSGYSCAYQYNVSWSSPTTPMTPESNPRLSLNACSARVRRANAPQFAAAPRAATFHSRFCDWKTRTRCSGGLMPGTATSWTSISPGCATLRAAFNAPKQLGPGRTR